jgi:hypothetical protein
MVPPNVARLLMTRFGDDDGGSFSSGLPLRD